MDKIKSRFLELDLLRGLAVVGMIVFHAFFILNFYEVLENEMFSGWWEVFGNLVRWVFLGLVGVGMVSSFFVRSGYAQAGRARPSLHLRLRAVRSAGLAWQGIRWQWRRAIVVFACGLVVSGVTALFLGESYVRFGILHLIGFSIFALSFVVWNRWLSLGVGLVAFWLGNTGFLVVGREGALDYFPIFPWIGVVAVGIWVGWWYLEKGRDSLAARGWGLWSLELAGGSRVLRALAFFGRNSLLIYLVHVPIIVLLLLVFGVLKWGMFA